MRPVLGAQRAQHRCQLAGAPDDGVVAGDHEFLRGNGRAEYGHVRGWPGRCREGADALAARDGQHRQADGTGGEDGSPRPIRRHPASCHPAPRLRAESKHVTVRPDALDRGWP